MRTVRPDVVDIKLFLAVAPSMARFPRKGARPSRHRPRADLDDLAEIHHRDAMAHPLSRETAHA
jgi:hypothetical protein